MKKYTQACLTIVATLSIFVHLHLCQEEMNDYEDEEKEGTYVHEQGYSDEDCEYEIPTNDTRLKNGEIHYHNFLTRVMEVVKNFAHKNKVRAHHYDTTSEYIRDLIKKNPGKAALYKEHLNHNVKTYSGTTHYGKATKCKKLTAEPEEIEYSVCNKGKAPKSFMPPLELIEYKDKMTWEVHKGLKLTKAKAVDIQAKPPDGMISDQSGIKKAISENGKTETTVHVRDAFTLAHNFTIDPLRKLIVRYITLREKVELPFTSELVLEGHVLAVFNRVPDGYKSSIKEFSVSNFANDLFQLRGKALVFNVTGIFKGARGITLETYYHEEPYRAGDNCKFLL